mgnify:CR=1 FL=1
MRVRVGTRADVDALMRIEREAATRFIAVGLPDATSLPCLRPEDFVDVLVAEEGAVAGFAVLST